MIMGWPDYTLEFELWKNDIKRMYVDEGLTLREIDVWLSAKGVFAGLEKNKRLNRVGSWLSKQGLRRTHSQNMLNRHKRGVLRLSFKVEKICKGCDQKYVANGGKQRYCKACCPNVKAVMLVRTYGMTWEQHQAIWNKQHGLCAICDVDLTTIKSNLVCVDHDHETGEVRGILCHRCNRRLVAVDDKQWHERALVYVSRVQTGDQAA